MNIIEVVLIFTIVFVTIVLDMKGKEKLSMDVELLLYGYLFARLFYVVANKINSLL